jgi:hypothetical protein
MKTRNRLPALACLLLIAAGAPAMAYDSPEYRVVETRAEYEVREYSPYLVVETTVDDRKGDPRNIAFRRLFSYISGNNVARADVAMTVPVTSTVAASAKIEMTVPVTTEPADDGARTMQFMLPPEYTLDTAPQPKDPTVSLRAIPAERVAVRRYSGLSNERNWRAEDTVLQAAIARDGLEVAGPSRLAVYNGPLTPWFMRRNEVVVPLR